MIYFSSDFHYNHTNLCLGTSKWSDKEKNCRNFDTIEEMNKAIVDSINSTVGENDTLYHLGDWSFGGWENIWHFRKQINCKHIIALIGNHDEHIRKDKFFPFLKKSDDGIIYEIYNKNNYQTLGIPKKKSQVSAKDLFDEVVDGRIRLYVGKQKIILDHYAYFAWEDSEKGSWMLYGHHHGDLKDNKSTKRLDVGWDVFRRPISFDEVAEIIKDRGFEKRH